MISSFLSALSKCADSHGVFLLKEDTLTRQCNAIFPWAQKLYLILIHRGVTKGGDVPFLRSINGMNSNQILLKIE